VSHAPEVCDCFFGDGAERASGSGDVVVVTEFGEDDEATAKAGGGLGGAIVHFASEAAAFVFLGVGDLVA
jgi:hypothetical protein